MTTVPPAAVTQCWLGPSHRGINPAFPTSD